jgi:hypothetical protein
MSPLYPDKRTLLGAIAMSASCHERTHAPQHNPCLFDHLVGAAEQHGWHVEAQRLRDLEIDHNLKPRWLLDRKVAGFLPAHDLRNVGRGAPPKIGTASAVGREPAKFAPLTET